MHYIIKTSAEMVSTPDSVQVRRKWDDELKSVAANDVDPGNIFSGVIKCVPPHASILANHPLC